MKEELASDNLDIKIKKSKGVFVVLHSCYPSTWKGKMGGWWISGQPGLHRETLPKKKKKQEEKEVLGKTICLKVW